MNIHPLPTTREVSRLIVVFLLLAGLGLAVAGCSTAPPPGVQVVDRFEISRYLGRWYEIARLDHRFERGLTNVSADYQLRSDGGIAVLNRGFDLSKGQWKEALGRAYFTGSEQTASLKVSFFGPFFGGYHVIALDRERYRWAMVVGPDTDYLWILARTPSIPASVRDRLLAQATSLGIDVSKLIWVSHDPVAESGVSPDQKP
jgi:apolipoprotein D and lipocalin family protein